MDNRNIFNQQQSSYYPYNGYSAAAAMGRTEVPAYMMPQIPVAAVLKGRPVSSFEEARVAQIDLDGSVSIFPDLGNKRIYTKRINVDGTASILTYTLDEHPVEKIESEYATRAEIDDLKSTLDAIMEKLQVKQNTSVKQPINF